MLVNTVSIRLRCFLIISFNVHLINAEKDGTNIVVQSESNGSGGGSVIVNSPKKGPQSIVVQAYGGTVVLNSHKKGGANIVINNNGKKKSDHHSSQHTAHNHDNHHHHDLKLPKIMPMLSESGFSPTSPNPSSVGARATKSFEPGEVDEKQIGLSPIVSQNREGVKSIKLRKRIKTKAVQEQKETEELVMLEALSRAKGDSIPESEPKLQDEFQSDANKQPSREEDLYSGYQKWSAPIRQSDTNDLKELDKIVEAQVEQQIKQQIESLIKQMTDDSSSDSGPLFPTSDSLPGPFSDVSESANSFESSNMDSEPDSLGYFSSHFDLDSETHTGFTLSDDLFGFDKDSRSGSDLDLLDSPWSRSY